MIYDFIALFVTKCHFIQHHVAIYLTEMNKKSDTEAPTLCIKIEKYFVLLIINTSLLNVEYEPS